MKDVFVCSKGLDHFNEENKAKYMFNHMRCFLFFRHWKETCFTLPRKFRNDFIGHYLDCKNIKETSIMRDCRVSNHFLNELENYG